MRRLAEAVLPLGDFLDRPLPRAPPTLHPRSRYAPPLCNLGYARGACDRFPDGDGPDAVRFTISRDEAVRSGIDYVIERDHLPLCARPA